VLCNDTSQPPYCRALLVVTSQRMVLTSGLLTRKVAMTPLSKVTDMSFQRSFLERRLRYGEFIIESAGQDRALRNIPLHPVPRAALPRSLQPVFPGGRAAGRSYSALICAHCV
jgi:uncharacterized membrane protein YdbT with pleckstrin-like domain